MAIYEQHRRDWIQNYGETFGQGPDEYAWEVFDLAEHTRRRIAAYRQLSPLGACSLRVGSLNSMNPGNGGTRPAAGEVTDPLGAERRNATAHMEADIEGDNRL